MTTPHVDNPPPVPEDSYLAWWAAAQQNPIAFALGLLTAAQQADRDVEQRRTAEQVAEEMREDNEG